VERKLRTRQWEYSQSVTHYMTEVLINEMQILDAKPQAVGNQQVTQDQVASTDSRVKKEALVIDQPDFDADIPC